MARGFRYAQDMTDEMYEDDNTEGGRSLYGLCRWCADLRGACGAKPSGENAPDWTCNKPPGHEYLHETPEGGSWGDCTFGPPYTPIQGGQPVTCRDCGGDCAATPDDFGHGWGGYFGTGPDPVTPEPGPRPSLRENVSGRSEPRPSDLDTIGIIANIALFGRSRDPAVLLDTIKRIASAVAEGQAKQAEQA